MGRVYEFVCGNDGDESVGTSAYHERVTMIFHDTTDVAVDEEDKENFRQMLAEAVDGWCEDLKEYDEKMILLAIQEALNKL